MSGARSLFPLLTTNEQQENRPYGSGRDLPAALTHNTKRKRSQGWRVPRVGTPGDWMFTASRCQMPFRCVGINLHSFEIQEKTKHPSICLKVNSNGLGGTGFPRRARISCPLGDTRATLSLSCHHLVSTELTQSAWLHLLFQNEKRIKIRKQEQDPDPRQRSLQQRRTGAERPALLTCWPEKSQNDVSTSVFSDRDGNK